MSSLNYKMGLVLVHFLQPLLRRQGSYACCLRACGELVVGSAERARSEAVSFLLCLLLAGTAGPSPSSELGLSLFPGSRLCILPHLHPHIPQTGKRTWGKPGHSSGWGSEERPDVAAGG